MSNTLFACITTIQPPTKAVLKLHERLQEIGARLVVAGDRKGPASFDLSGCDFLSLAGQLNAGFTLAENLPVGHYARKNIAYLHAIREGASCIYETDDDNEPLISWSRRMESVARARTVHQPSGKWVNVYRSFSGDARIWPRGFPLERISDQPAGESDTVDVIAPIQQGLVDGSPDVDAVWRLTQDRPFRFDVHPPVFLGEGQWCPFNTQSTWWWPAAYPLLYVPSYCSFRMCDIWKSYVAQRCLWAMGSGVVFHASEVFQDRNPHDYLKDFADEVPGYLNNSRIASILESLNLAPGPDAVADNLMICYRALIAAGLFPESEKALVNAWVEDLAAIGSP